MKPFHSRVFVVEDDPSMRNALKNLLKSVGLQPELFASAEQFLDGERPDLPSCLILDVRLPGLDGIDDLQKKLRHWTWGHLHVTARPRGGRSGISNKTLS